MPGGRVGRDHNIGPGGLQVFFGPLFAGTGDNLQPRLDALGRQDNINIGGIGGSAPGRTMRENNRVSLIP